MGLLSVPVLTSALYALILSLSSAAASATAVSVAEHQSSNASRSSDVSNHSNAPSSTAVSAPDRENKTKQQDVWARMVLAGLELNATDIADQRQIHYGKIKAWWGRWKVEFMEFCHKYNSPAYWVYWFSFISWWFMLWGGIIGFTYPLYVSVKFLTVKNCKKRNSSLKSSHDQIV